MAASVQQVFVSSRPEVENAIQSFIAQGYTVQSQTEESVTMFKKKQFNILWAVTGFFLCLIPLLIYCTICAGESDKMVVIRLGQAAGMAPNRWSGDGRFFWDGGTWRDAATAGVPPYATISDDGRQWWDGFTWRAIGPQLHPAPDMVNPPPTDPLPRRRHISNALRRTQSGRARPRSHTAHRHFCGGPIDAAFVDPSGGELNQGGPRDCRNCQRLLISPSRCCVGICAGGWGGGQP